MGSDEFMNSANLNDKSEKISSPVVKAIASHVDRWYPAVPQASTQSWVEPTSQAFSEKSYSESEKVYVEKTTSINNSVEIVFEDKHAPTGLDNIFGEKRA
jgi:hypothetical protein